MSVIIPVFNAEKYIARCIESLLSQIVDNYEVIIIDDGSTDNSYAVIDAYAKRFPQKIKAFKQSNSGQGQARNNGIVRAEGKYILFVDSDDIVSPNLIAYTGRVMEREHADIVIFDAEITDETGRRIESLCGCNSNEPVLCLKKYPELLLEYPAPWNKMYRKNLFTNHKLFYPTHIWYEDLVGASMFYTGADKIVVLHEELYKYIQHPSSVMHSKASKRNLEIITAIELIIEFYKKNNIYDIYYTELEFMGIYHILIAAMGRTIRGKCERSMNDKFLDFMEKQFPQWRKNPYMCRLSRIQKLKLALLSRRQYGVVSNLYKLGSMGKWIH